MKNIIHPTAAAPTINIPRTADPLSPLTPLLMKGAQASSMIGMQEKVVIVLKHSSRAGQILNLKSAGAQVRKTPSVIHDHHLIPCIYTTSTVTCSGSGADTISYTGSCLDPLHRVEDRYKARYALAICLYRQHG